MGGGLGKKQANAGWSYKHEIDLGSDDELDLRPNPAVLPMVPAPVPDQDACQLDAVLTVVDAKHVTAHLDEEKPEGVVNEAVQQVAFADKVRAVRGWCFVQQRNVILA